MAKVRTILLSLLTLLFCSCERDGLDLTLSVGPYGAETRKVMLLYEAGFNTISGDIASNITTLTKGWLPGKGRNDDVLLVMSHVVKSNFDEKTSPVLIRMYQEYGEPVMDTLATWPVGTYLGNAGMVTEVFNWVRERFPAAGYGAVLSSHGSGWLPAMYYDNPEIYEGKARSSSWGGSASFAPQHRSFGVENYTNKLREEIEIHDLAAAIPYHLDYIFFDACFMGSVEVAWELRNVCSYMAASPCEIPAAGCDYKTIAERLLKPKVPDLKAVCQDYFDMYESGSVYGAAITMVDCGRLDRLASTCRDLFDRYRSGILNLSGKNVQSYDRRVSSHTYFAIFDLKDMLREAGSSDEDLALLQAALDEAIVFEAHTSEFLKHPLDRCCGLSVYLPAYPNYKRDIYHGTEFLDGFYKENVAWNQATSLVQ